MTTPEPRTTVAIFDLDGTITFTDTYVGFLFAYLRHRPQRAFRAYWLPFAVLLHWSGFRDNTWLKTAFLTAIAAGESRDIVQKIAAKFCQTVASKKLRPAALNAIKRHREQGHKLVLATASLDIYSEIIGEALGFDTVLSTKVLWNEEGRLTGQLDGPNCYGKAKRIAVEKHLSDRESLHVISYSDHISDLPLLDWSDRGIFVGPEDSLRRKFGRTPHEHLIW